jgi:hypothetical protein
VLRRDAPDTQRNVTSLRDIPENDLRTLPAVSFENVSHFKYLRATVTNGHLIKEEVKRRLNSGNACYHLVENLLSSRLLSKSLKTRTYKTIILPVVLYGCET